jgi:hypothetical protein
MSEISGVIVVFDRIENNVNRLLGITDHGAQVVVTVLKHLWRDAVADLLQVC